MKVQTYFVHLLYSENQDYRPSVAIVVDILRASTTLCAALASGAEQIIPFSTVEEVLAAASHRGDILLAGERSGKKLREFDLGNSPLEYTKGKVQGKTIYYTTSNGTQAITRVRSVPFVFIASFLNRRSVVDAILSVVEDDGELAILCAGTDGDFALEDALGAGAVLHALSSCVPDLSLDDASFASLRLFKLYQDDLTAVLCATQHGRFLKSIGYDADIAFAAQLDLLSVVPQYREGLIKPYRENIQ